MNRPTAIFYSMTIDRMLASVRSRVPEFCGMKAGDRVLDVCCGTGAQAISYAQRGITSWGIDMDPGMIEFAEKRRRRLSLNTSFFQIASAGDLPFRDACFEHASICMGLHEKEAPLRDRIVSEMKRVVKEYGVIAIVDYSVPFPEDACGHAARLVERMAGRDHHRCFDGFIEEGGLDSLVRRHRLREEKREYLKGLPMVLLKLRNA